jgi:hypothetical protein
MVLWAIPLGRSWQGLKLGQTVESDASGFEGVRLWAELAGTPSAQTTDGSGRRPDARRPAVVARECWAAAGDSSVATRGGEVWRCSAG